MKAAGRGGLAVLAAKIFFIATGFVQQPLLQLAIGQADYGALARVLPVSNVFNSVIVSSSTQGVSRTVAAASNNHRWALRSTLRTHTWIAIVAVLMLVGVAPIVARFQAAPEVFAPLVIMAAVLGVYGVYAPLVGYLNGRGMFVRQATLDIVAASARTVLFLGLGWLFAHYAGRFAARLHTAPSLLGVTLGGVIAAVIVCLVALRWTGTGGPSNGESNVPSTGAYVRLIVPVMIGQLFTNGLMQADIFLLGHYLSVEAIGTNAPEHAANEWVAVYRACQLFAFLPYQMLFSVTQVLFPMVARAKAAEPERVPQLVARGSRIGALVCGLLVVIVLSLPATLLNFAYGPKVALNGAATLRILGVAQAFFAMLGLATTILVSLGRERLAMVMTALGLGALVAGVILSSRGSAFGEDELVATAKGALSALAVVLVVAVLVVKRFAGAFVPWRSALRIGACVVGAYFLGGHMPMFGKLLAPVAAAAIGVLYIGLLVLTGEIGKADLGLVLAVVNRRGGRGSKG